MVRERLMATLNSWLAAEGLEPVKRLSGEDLMHAVARGAAYLRNGAAAGAACAYVAACRARITSASRAAMPAAPGFPAPLKALAVVPFGMEEGTEVRIPGREFGLVVGAPAEFRFFTSAARKNDQPGDLIEDFSGDQLKNSPPWK
jgi:hypothetical protein